MHARGGPELDLGSLVPRHLGCGLAGAQVGARDDHPLHSRLAGAREHVGAVALELTAHQVDADIDQSHHGQTIASTLS